MELVVRKTDLRRELQLFQGIVERKNTIPILANVLLEAPSHEEGIRRARRAGLRRCFNPQLDPKAHVARQAMCRIPVG